MNEFLESIQWSGIGGAMLKLTVALLFSILVCVTLRKYDPRWIVKFSRITLLVTPVLLGVHFYAPSNDWASIELPIAEQSLEIISSDSLLTSNLVADVLPESSFSLGLVLFSIWVLGSIVMLSREVIGLFILHGSRLETDSVSAELHKSWQRILLEFGLKPIKLCTMQQVQSPFITFSKGRALVVVPACMDSEELEPVVHALRHEAAHLRSKDHVWIPLMRLILCSLWFHPLVWCLALSHHHACEEACDAEAARVGGVQEYRKALAKIALNILPIKQSSIATFISIPSVTGRIKRVNETVPFRPPGLLGLMPIACLMIASILGLGMLQLEASEKEKTINEVVKKPAEVEKKTSMKPRYVINDMKFSVEAEVNPGADDPGRTIDLSEKQKRAILKHISKANIVKKSDGAMNSKQPDISTEELMELKKAMIESLRRQPAKN